ncbi:MAG: 4-hydroxythreonine-4-phosphate dehydrogenase PdxA [Deltaproteobacteria bacterium]|nr:4-hydroxythreonine-4-phosphate dehydrogenase PdxA [Deltaproteobacteria bacterium]
MTEPIIAITAGDPAGIGPEIILKAATSPEWNSGIKKIVIGKVSVFKKTLTQLNLGIKIEKINDLADLIENHNTIPVFEVESLSDFNFQMGQLQPECGELAFQSILKAVELAQTKQIKAIVTAPINKEALHLAGRHFDGHTGLLAHLTQTKLYRMLFASEKLKIIHVTAHMALKEACETITEEMVFQTIRLGHEHLIQLGMTHPRVAVCGLNPHAGESGIFGSEDQEIILPAIKKAHERGIKAEGPFPGDTVFLKALKGQFDMVVAQYHDQGHIPGKLIAFDSGVNVTLGLPIIRTSVDHGTAFDIAGKNTADYQNLFCAIKYAEKLVT